MLYKCYKVYEDEIEFRTKIRAESTENMKN